MPEEATMGQEKVVDKRAATLEAKEKEKGMEALKNVFGFTDEEIGVIQEVSQEGLDEMIKKAGHVVELAGENAGFLTKYYALKGKIEAFDPKALRDLGSVDTGYIVGREKELVEGGTTMADLLRSDLKGRKPKLHF